MSARARWIVLGAAMVFALVGLWWFAANSPQSTRLERAPKTWLVQPGDTLRVPADEVLLDDVFDCVGEGYSDGYRYEDALSAPGGFTGSTMVVDAEGNVTVHCIPGSGFNP